MRQIISAKSMEEAYRLRRDLPEARYVSGGTEVLRLNGSVPDATALIDVSAFLSPEIEKKHDAIMEKMSVNASPDERFEAMKKAAKLPRNANRTRLHNRCSVTGRARGYSRWFGLCRQQFRTLASEGKLPGVRKSSW